MQHPHVVHKGRASNNKVDRKKVCSQYKFVNVHYDDQYISEYLQSYMVQQKISLICIKTIYRTEATYVECV